MKIIKSCLILPLFIFTQLESPLYAAIFGNSTPTISTISNQSEPTKTTEDPFVTASKEYNAGNFQRAFSIFKSLATKGNSNAQYNLGIMYHRGEGTPKDNANSLNWLLISAKNNNKNAQFQLGVMYDRGFGVKQDYKESLKWFLKASKQGNPPADFSIGDAYRRGLGVPIDDSEANKWYLKAANKGFAPAQNNIALSYEYGTGISQDYSLAAKWYLKSALQGIALSQKNLGLLYFRGLGVPKNDIHAYKWLNICVQGLKINQGRDEAVKTLGNLQKSMSSSQIEIAHKLILDWKPLFWQEVASNWKNLSEELNE